VVGGNSLGGHGAIALTLAHPDRVSGLVLTGSSGLLAPRSARGVPRRPSREYVRQEMEEAFFDPSLVTDAWVARSCDCGVGRPVHSGDCPELPGPSC
jgi:pimeloyl-ACP methyl ester carboxylesterase